MQTLEQQMSIYMRYHRNPWNKLTHFVGVPVIIGAGGAERIVEIDLNAAERNMFIKSVESVKGLVDACTKIAPQLGA